MHAVVRPLSTSTIYTKCMSATSPFVYCCMLFVCYLLIEWVNSPSSSLHPEPSSIEHGTVCEWWVFRHVLSVHHLYSLCPIITVFFFFFFYLWHLLLITPADYTHRLLCNCSSSWCAPPLDVFATLTGHPVQPNPGLASSQLTVSPIKATYLWVNKSSV